MYYVYIIKSINYPKQIYIGYTNNIHSRLERHNNGHIPHTTKFKPWEIATYTLFQNKEKALGFEKYLKSGSGRQFVYRHLL